MQNKPVFHICQEEKKNEKIVASHTKTTYPSVSHPQKQNKNKFYIMKIKKYSNDKISEGRKICNKHCLYVPTWSFSLWLGEYYEEYLKSIYIIFDGEKPIGSCLVLNSTYDVNIGVFIKPQYRNRGFGKKLIRFVARNNKSQKLQYDMGMMGSLEFFEKAKQNIDNLQRVSYGESIV